MSKKWESLWALKKHLREDSPGPRSLCLLVNVTGDSGKRGSQRNMKRGWGAQPAHRTLKGRRTSEGGPPLRTWGLGRKAPQLHFPITTGSPILKVGGPETRETGSSRNTQVALVLPTFLSSKGPLCLIKDTSIQNGRTENRVSPPSISVLLLPVLYSKCDCKMVSQKTKVWTKSLLLFFIDVHCLLLVQS